MVEWGIGSVHASFLDGLPLARPALKAWVVVVGKRTVVAHLPNSIYPQDLDTYLYSVGAFTLGSGEVRKS